MIELTSAVADPPTGPGGVRSMAEGATVSQILNRFLDLDVPGFMVPRSST